MDLANLKQKIKQIDWVRTGLLIAIIVALFVALRLYLMPPVATISTSGFQAPPTIHATDSIERVVIPAPAKGIITLDKKAVAKKLNLPWLQGGDIAGSKQSGEVTTPAAAGTKSPVSPVAGNPADLQITATAELPESEAGTQVLSVLNTATGETTLVAKELPLPWFALENKGQLSVWYGLNQRLQQTADVEGRWQFLRIKRLHLGLRGSLGTDGDARLQAGTIYEW